MNKLVISTIALLSLAGCATKPPTHSYVIPATVTIQDYGINMDGIHQACKATVENGVTKLVACD